MTPELMDGRGEMFSRVAAIVGSPELADAVIGVFADGYGEIVAQRDDALARAQEFRSSHGACADARSATLHALRTGELAGGPTQEALLAASMVQRLQTLRETADKLLAVIDLIDEGDPLGPLARAASDGESSANWTAFDRELAAYTASSFVG